MPEPSPTAALRFVTVEQLEDNGLAIDRNCYPWIAYTGDRYSPSLWFACRTPAWDPGQEITR